jgi:hypothetical protein
MGREQAGDKESIKSTRCKINNRSPFSCAHRRNYKLSPPSRKIVWPVRESEASDFYYFILSHCKNNNPHHNEKNFHIRNSFITQKIIVYFSI